MKRLLIIITTAVIAIAAMAGPVSENAARDIAAQFFGNRPVAIATFSKPTLAAKAPRKAGIATATPAYYVFNNEIDNGGWVIVAGDDRARQILAYSDEGNFDPYNLSDGAQWMLEMFASVIDNIDNLLPDKAPAPDEAHLFAINKSSIPPMLTCRWGQRAPFYFQCPKSGGSYCVTGCVATAMAQVMYYHKWPTSVSTIPAYTPSSGSVKGIEQDALPSTTFDYSQMYDYYSSNETNTTSTANAMVAKLLHYVGQAALMNYGTSSSGTTTSPHALYKYFKYNSKVKAAARVDYSATDWVDLIYTELNSGRPVILSGNKHSGGHAFVCDGYDNDNGLFHINWGWYGSSNGYFSLDVLNPSGGGTGSIDGKDGYVVDLRAMVGLEPLRSGSSTVNNDNLFTKHVFTGASGTTYFWPEVGSSSYTRSGSTSDFAVSVTGCFWNNSKFSDSYDLAWGLYQGTTLKKTMPIYTNRTLNAANLTWPTATISFGSGLENGIYYLRQMSRRNGSSKWQLMIGAMETYIKVQIIGSTVRLTPISPDQNGMTITNCTYDGTKKVGHPIAIKPTITNKSTSEYKILYLFIDGEIAGANGVNVPIDGSATAAIHYTPSSVGTKKVEICSDNDGNHVLYTGSLSIAASGEASLSASFTIPGLSGGYISTTSVNATAKMTNTGSTYYGDDIIFKLYKYSSSTNNYPFDRSTTSYLSVAAGSTVNITAAFNDLTPGAQYLIQANYYSNGELAAAGQSSSFTVKDSSSKYDLNGDGQVNTGDVSALYAALLVGSTSSKYDLNGDGNVNTGDISELYNKLLN